MTFLETIFAGVLVCLITNRMKEYLPNLKGTCEPKEIADMRAAKILAIVGTGLMILNAPFVTNGALALIVAASHMGQSAEAMSTAVRQCLLGSALFRLELILLVWLLLAVFLPKSLANIMWKRRQSAVWRFLLGECKTLSVGGVAFALLSILSLLGWELLTQAVPAAQCIF